MNCCCSMAGTKACEQCRMSKGDFDYISSEPIIFNTPMYNYICPKCNKVINAIFAQHECEKVGD